MLRLIDYYEQNKDFSHPTTYPPTIFFPILVDATFCSPLLNKGPSKKTYFAVFHYIGFTISVPIYQMDRYSQQPIYPWNIHLWLDISVFTILVPIYHTHTNWTDIVKNWYIHLGLDISVFVYIGFCLYRCQYRYSQNRYVH
jgi:hypothetical protein